MTRLGLGVITSLQSSILVGRKSPGYPNTSRPHWSHHPARSSGALHVGQRPRDHRTGDRHQSPPPMLAPQPFIPGQDSTFQRFCHSLFLLAWKSVFLLPAGPGFPGCVFRLSALLLCVLPSLIHPDLRDTLTEQDTLREPKCHGDPCKTRSLAHQHSNTVLVLLILDNASCFKPLPFVVLAPIIDNGLI